MLLAVAGTKGALGATTLSYGLALLLHGQSPWLLIEADPDGGSLAARLRVPQEPGLSTLAAAGRHELSPESIAAHVQKGPFGLQVIVAPSSPRHARAALRAVAGRLGRSLFESEDAHAVLDLGRLDADSPSLELAAAASMVILMAGPTLDGADAAAVRLAEMDHLRSTVTLVTVGDGPYRGEELADVLSVGYFGHIPDDRSGAASLWSPHGYLRSRRRPFMRGLISIASRIRKHGDPPNKPSNGHPGSGRAHPILHRSSTG